ncbi:hypothetical protein [Rhodopirellula bahusiensis]|uniref:Uncharacterized protein n=1 Tax=Rhodopirellula bahusiensis TaxID=2014065 RepID=A0A2G1W2N1_9BACT|nr:hypothetical protein [Rhodopirellula bahusiensis]PHQ33120.1 hypothetical protein CEE69_21915 [Rhodopirellula bahusiensis]
MARSNWPPPAITPIFTPEAAPSELKPVEAKKDFGKAAEDSKAPKLSKPAPAPSPGGPILSRGSVRETVAEKTSGDALPDTRTGKDAPRQVDFNRLGRHRTTPLDRGPGLG